MHCPQCGKINEMGARYCSSCGFSLDSPSSTPSPRPAPVATRSVGLKIGCIVGTVVLVMTLLLVFGIVGSIFYGIKKSTANQIAVEALKRNPAAHEALGDIEKIGWPIGSISVQGSGSGNASFSMSVRGSKAQGKYYATLKKVNGLWTLQSSRLQMKDGRSIELGGSPSPTSGLSPPNSPPSGGRQLKAESSAVEGWRSLEWTAERIPIQVPEHWTQTKLDKDGVEFRAPDRSAYFFGNVVSFHQKIPVDQLIPSLVQKASGEFQDGQIAGYALKELGKGRGILQIERRQDGSTMASWEGYDDSESETKSYTFVMGASSPKDFDRWDGAFGAILESIKIP